MENGSKALIIAGAILLAILIIGLGVFIYNQASNTVGDTGMDQVAIRQFNGKFEQYLNKELGAVQAKALIDTVNLSNQAGKQNVNLPVLSDKNQIITGHKYLTDVSYENGVITGISITDANGSSGGGSISGELSEDVLKFNSQFEPYVPTIYPNEEGTRKELSQEQIEAMWGLINSINNHLSGHYIETIDTRYGAPYYTTVGFDANGYINFIQVFNVNGGSSGWADGVKKQ